MIKRLFRRLKWLLLAMAFLVLFYQLWLFAWIVYWKNNNPDMTQFMEIRLAELRIKTPSATLKKQWVDYAKISLEVKKALIASEDGLFVQHAGFDWNGIQKAIEKNEKRGKIVAGGSSISQQLAKNLFLSPEKSLLRKAEEAAITLMLESVWSKQRIFEVYLNVIEWGNGVFGIEAAAKHYYGKRAQNLSAEEAAHLAAMVPRPRYYDTRRNTDGLTQKADTILARMPSAQIP